MTQTHWAMATDNENRDIDPKPQSVTRSKRLYDSAQARGTQYYERGKFWVENVDPAYPEGRDDRMVQALPGGRRPAVRRSAHGVPLPHAGSAVDRRDELRLQGSRGARGAPRPAIASERDDQRPPAVRAGRLGWPQILGGAACGHQPVLLRRRLRPCAPARPCALLGARSAQERTARPGHVLRDHRRRWS